MVQTIEFEYDETKKNGLVEDLKGLKQYMGTYEQMTGNAPIENAESFQFEHNLVLLWQNTNKGSLEFGYSHNKTKEIIGILTRNGCKVIGSDM